MTEVITDDGYIVLIKEDDLTLAEGELFEELAGISIDAFATPGVPKFKALRSLAYITLKRKYPNKDHDELWELVGTKKPRFEAKKSTEDEESVETQTKSDSDNG